MNTFTIHGRRLPLLVALSLLIIGLLVVAPADIVVAQDEPGFGEDVVTATTEANLNIRNAPNLDGELLDTLPFGTVVGFTGLTDTSGNWVQVSTIGGLVGWVSAAYLSNVPDGLTVWPEEGALVPEEPEAEEPTFGDDVVTATTTANLNVRNAPSLDGDILGNLPFGTVVGFTGLSDPTGQWVQVDSIDGPVGWVWVEYLSNVPDDLTVWTADGSAADEPSAAEPVFSEDVVTATTTANVNIRNAPSLDGDILANLPFGTVVGFTGLTDATGSWVQVDAVDGPVGWVWAGLLSNVPADLTVWTGG